LADRVPAAVRKERSEKMRAVIEGARQVYQESFLGKVEKVLWERSKKVGSCWLVDGLTDNYLRVQAEAEQDMQNQFSDVCITESSGSKMNGVIR
jgi:tRNA A37 methylthiotransferase MiaB